ncbi:MAG TPA: glycerol-3-phosphate 1-O-acyltransferase [Spongiibacteraceae bacterium]|nr:glycerol-3-phosphate 1-O-acyltransferase [Spongiibacteraceae bacterium]HCS27766.1 glycerol-3-phosphate 1-O-acyltransferase [Spongiibacteraceae bacterium]
MSWIGRFAFYVFRIVVRPVLWVVKPQVIPEDLTALKAELADKPVCYVLAQHSWSDRLVVERLCRELELPRISAPPGQLPDADHGACLYLPVLAQLDRTQSPEQLLQALRNAAEESGANMQVVPVSIFWGRDPGSETSILKLLVGDAERAGRLRKLLIMLVQGRSVLVNFAKPVDFKEFLQRQPDHVQAANLLHRGLSFHFLRQKTATLGPSLLSRQQMINAVMRRPTVKQAMLDEAHDQSLSRDVVRKRARKMADEVAANFDPRMIRFLDIVLSWVFRKIFSGVKTYNVDRLRSVANKYHVIYMPSHRSHLDYLLISWTLYCQGLVPPHIAAGVNLNFWPAGGLLRRGGAFYIRRSFAGQPLYTAIFKAYLDVLLGHGYPVEFFPEGGRSRTGRLLPAKRGMLGMVVESFLAQPSRAAALVPVYVGYDKLVESGAYVKELRGGNKQKESAGELLKARKIFKSSYGSPHVAFGEPIILSEALARLEPQWRSKWQNEDKSWLPVATERLARMNMERVNQAAVINPIGLVSAILLSSPQRAMAEDELLEQIDRFLGLISLLPYSKDVVLPTQTATEVFEAAARTAGLSRIDHAWGPIVTVTGNEAVMLTYYRNSIMHVFALPSLIARFFRHSSDIDEHELVERCVGLYPFLKRELFLHWPIRDAGKQVQDLINAMVERGLLIRTGTTLSRPDIGSSDYSALIGLGRLLRETFERYTMCSLVLVHQLSDKPTQRSAIEEHIIHMAQRLAILTGREAPEYFDKTLFRIYLDALIDQGLLEEQTHIAKNILTVNPRLQELAEHWVWLLGPAVQQGIQQLIRDPRLSLQEMAPEPESA